jgi:mediator of RNA polymerase II transcription subunit 6
MTDYNGTPLDELQWREPEAVAYHNGITAENIHLYFMYSPFCDPTSNNKVLELQLKFNEGQYPILLSRTEFETRLRGMQGLEYMIVEGPTKTEPGMNPVWVIRKQRRTKERGREDSLAVLGSYFAVGENIYQAPSVEDILTCRLVNMNQLSSALVSIC